MYLEAATVVGDTIRKKGSLKNLVFSSSCKNKKALYALCCESLRYKKPLLEIAADCGILKDKRLRNNDNLLAVLMYEHLLGKGVSGKYKVLLQKYKSSIHSRCVRLKLEHRVTQLKDAFQNMMPAILDKPLPKYVRINTLVARKEDVMRQLQGKFELRNYMRGEKLNGLDKAWFMEDEHIPDLLMFHPAVEFHSDPLYMSGKVIIQDKASCFPAYILNPPAGSTVIDCCAAPGNKTTHLAAIMNNTGTIYAFDKDARRLATLQKLVSKAEATCVRPECRDFLSVDPENKEYKNVEYILVDPSCSGSGMVNRQLQFTDEEESCSTKRLQQLAKFQISILKHALRFPHVKKVVYSTCSIHDEENEMVVEEVCTKVSDLFEIENIMPEWKYRGKTKYKHGIYCLRMSYEDCQTNGFFVSSFVRKSDKLVCDVVKGTINRVGFNCNSNNDDLNIVKKNSGKHIHNGVTRGHILIGKNAQTVKATTEWTVVNESI